MSDLFSTPRRVKRGWMNMRVDKIIDDTHDTKTFILVDHDEGGRPFDYIAGQYLTFRFDNIQDKPIVRSYTMSSSPREEGYSAFTVKRVENGLISNWLCDNVKVGSILRGRGPIGRFCYDPGHDRDHLFMIAAGSGVTPFLSIMREHYAILGAAGSPKKMSLLVSYRTEKDIIGLELLNKMTKAANAHVHITLSRANVAPYLHGRINQEILVQTLPKDPKTATYMLCGPVEMMDLAKGHLLQHGVTEDHVKTEAFDS